MASFVKRPSQKVFEIIIIEPKCSVSRCPPPIVNWNCTSQAKLKSVESGRLHSNYLLLSSKEREDSSILDAAGSEDETIFNAPFKLPLTGDIGADANNGI